MVTIKGSVSQANQSNQLYQGYDPILTQVNNPDPIVPSYRIEKASLSDLSQVIQINNQHLHTYLMPESRTLGFLQESMSVQSVLRTLEKGYSYLVAKTTQNEVVGFMALSKGLPKEILYSLIFRSTFEEKKKVLLQPSSMFIDTIAIKKGYQRMGIGSALYQYLFTKTKATVFSAFIANKPYDNQASVQFHRSLGFKLQAKFQLPTNPHLGGFQSNLFVKL